MRRYTLAIVALFLALGGLAACRGPAPPQSGFRDLLGYVPGGLAALRVADLYGPPVHMADFDRMRYDLRLPRVTGADSRQAKLPVITKLAVQNLELWPRALEPASGSAFDEWGWDVADIRQALYIPDLQACVLLGDFGRSEVRDRLQEKRYAESDVDGYALFTAEDRALVFALVDDALVITMNEQGMRLLLAERTHGVPTLAEHPSVAALLPRLEGAWAAWLAPSGDLEALAREVEQNLPEEIAQNLPGYYQRPGEEAWDLAAVACWGPGEERNVSFFYHYPSAEEAEQDVALARQRLTEAPSLRYRDRTWGDLVQLQNVKVEGTVLAAEVTASDRWSVYAAIRDRDCTWLLVREPEAE